LSDIKVLVISVTIMNFQGGDDYIIMFVTRQLLFLFVRLICHIDLYTIYLTQMKYV